MLHEGFDASKSLRRLNQKVAKEDANYPESIVNKQRSKESKTTWAWRTLCTKSWGVKNNQWCELVKERKGKEEPHTQTQNKS